MTVRLSLRGVPELAAAGTPPLLATTFASPIIGRKLLSDSDLGRGDRGVNKIDEDADDFKLDGARVQVHKQGEEVRVFSRQLNDEHSI